jgi:predicted TIM-barrel enzyme
MEVGREVNPDIFFLAHGGPINTPEDVRVILDKTDAHGFVGASSLERMDVEKSLTDLTRKFKALIIENRKKVNIENAGSLAKRRKP